MSDRLPIEPPELLFCAAGTAPTLHVPGVGVTISTLVATADSAGKLAVLEYTAPPMFRGPAPHWHSQVTETFVGLGGVAHLRSGDTEVLLEPGSVAVVPPGVVHTFSNPSAEPARFLVIATPGAGLEGYFGELAGLIAASPEWPPRDPAAMAEIAARYDTFSPPAPAV
jgi:mannose-6-phosphate isomerase-like protein (cupin superfamily)